MIERHTRAQELVTACRSEALRASTALTEPAKTQRKVGIATLEKLLARVE
jgi:hypothetical protein